MSVEIRPFRRADRDQLTALVNAHAQAVVPGVVVSVNAVLSQLEHDPGEFIVDPWVVERATLVAEQRGRIVAGAHLLRYGTGPDVGEAYRDAGEIRWLLCWPDASFWPDALQCGVVVADACVERLSDWSVSRLHADGTLPAPACFGLPEQWPHIRHLLLQAGFAHTGHVELVFLAALSDIPEPGPEPVAGITVRRSLGVNGTRLSAALGDEVLGYVEVEVLTDGARIPLPGGLADVGNLHVAEAHRGRGLEDWLLGHAAQWLRLARVDRLLAYAGETDADEAELFLSSGFRLLTRVERGWTRPAPG
jgi:GNAT superfamily N-acetyltransferase